MVDGTEPAVGVGADIAGRNDAVGILVFCVPQTL